MATPENVPAFDLEIAFKAGVAYLKNASTRQQKEEQVKSGNLESVEGKRQLAKRVNRLVSHLKKQVAGAGAVTLPSAVASLVERGSPVTAAEVDDIEMERVIGATRDFLSASYLQAATRTTRAVGRVVTRLSGGRFAHATGFLVAPGVLLTNWHVFKGVERARESKVEFDYQLDEFGHMGTVHSYVCDPASFFCENEELDYAFVALRTQSDRGRALSDYGWCPLISEEGKINTGEPVNIIQHPMGRPKEIVLRENALQDKPENRPFALHYLGDTERGSSGSPALNDQWEVVALHHTAVPEVNNTGEMMGTDGRVWRRGDDPARIHWIANEGIRISRLIAHFRGAPLPAAMEPLRRRVLDAGSAATVPKPVPDEMMELEAARPETQPARRDEAQPGPVVDFQHLIAEQSQPNTPPAMQNITINIYGPGTQPTVSSQSAAAQSPQAVEPVTQPKGAQTPAVTLTENDEPDRDYSNRKGFAPDFLGFSAPMPKLTEFITDAATVPTADGTPTVVIPYHHFSVILSTTRRLAYCSAVNFDGGARFNHRRDDGREVWWSDDRLAEEVQNVEANYRHRDVDRGHLTRRADAAWGSTAAEAKDANDDTFHFTNNSPQHSVFNQSSRTRDTDIQRWGDLEEHLAGQIRDQRIKASIYNGPILRASDRPHFGLKIPAEFYKIAVFRHSDGRPRALAFILSQADLTAGLPEEGIEPGVFVVNQVPVRQIEELTGLDFGVLKDYDPMRNDAIEGDDEEEAGDKHESFVARVRGRGHLITKNRGPRL